MIKKNADTGSPATGRLIVILKILQMERKDSRCSSCPETDGVVYVIVIAIVTRPQATVPLFLQKCDQIIVDVMILVCPARVLARQVGPPRCFRYWQNRGL